jgi:hypothetical protein
MTSLSANRARPRMLREPGTATATVAGETM